MSLRVQAGQTHLLLCAQETPDHEQGPAFLAELTLMDFQLQPDADNSLRPANDHFTSRQLSQHYGTTVECFTLLVGTTKVGTTNSQSSISQASCERVNTDTPGITLRSCPLPEVPEYLRKEQNHPVAFNVTLPVSTNIFPVSGPATSASITNTASRAIIGAAVFLALYFGTEGVAIATIGLNMLGIAIRAGVPSGRILHGISLKAMEATVNLIFVTAVLELTESILNDYSEENYPVQLYGKLKENLPKQFRGDMFSEAQLLFSILVAGLQQRLRGHTDPDKRKKFRSFA